MEESKAQWSSRVGFILASLGMAFGTGNIWRFPRVAAANGGGAFLIAFLIATILWAVPLLMMEMVMGKTTRLGTVGAFRNFCGKKYTWFGAWIGFCSVAIMFYYSVVMGWALRYFVYGITGAIKPGIDSETMWKAFLNDPSQTILFHFISIAIAGFIIYRGVKEGLEIANKTIVPSMLVLLIVVMVWALTKPNAVQGLEYLYNPNLSQLLDAKVWLNAFTQAAWSVGAGWGLMLTYAVYMRDEDDIGANSFVVAFADSGSSLISAMAVLPLVFAVSPSVEVAKKALESGHTGMTFIYLTKFFPNLPGGTFFAALFFLALSIAALASLLSMVELATLNLQDMGIDRKKAAILVTVVTFLLGIPSAYSSWFLDNQDMVWGVGLLIAGVLYSLAAYRYGIDRVRTEIINPNSYVHIGKWWNYAIGGFPIMFAFVFGWWILQSITWYPKTWWNPFEQYSPATMVIQWSVVALVFYLANNWLAEKIKAPYKEVSARESSADRGEGRK
ncbi:sodium-dependent transporter [Thermosediminibacter oceani]|uniref:Sodium:neurotransmitter symporter n=1 Tax=Thermosediminibacter oceani (strain ATCC BAA-1034 / DSM 16646 / JW/IW-1228P) TaxID=555079 RepID=D9S0X8_THEOJ|nr:sodium-dependent transporter [Thermosediminibacter oceani]ADL07142.1 sodium:neurotransmitter symporter [Thermosediminibacter oceani DSM 16646]